MSTDTTTAALDADDEQPKLHTDHREPLKPSGALDTFEYFEVTPVIGREFVNVDLADLLRTTNSDEFLRELAITVSRRGVVFFRKQDNLTDGLLKELAQRLGEQSGKPATSQLHIHPVNNAAREYGSGDNEVSVVSSKQAKRLFSDRYVAGPTHQSLRNEWHSDIAFEPVPSDYAVLKVTQLPKTGGDTLWASGYEVYDRISPTLQRFLETLTAKYAQPMFSKAAQDNKFSIYSAERGAPENSGEILEAVHPVIRTNPVTGWKSVYAVGQHVESIHGLTEAESRHFLGWFTNLIMENHDLQVRFKWKDVNDVAIWDNRSTYHAATPDYIYDRDLGERYGTRAVSVGEKPYLDPQSKGRREALWIERLGV